MNQLEIISLFVEKETNEFSLNVFTEFTEFAEFSDKNICCYNKRAQTNQPTRMLPQCQQDRRERQDL